MISHMSRRSPLLVVAVMIALFWHTGPQQAWACTCAHPPVDDARSVYDAYDAVATVDVLEFDSGRGLLRVDRAYKGISRNTATIEFDRGDRISSCDYDQFDATATHFVALMLRDDGGYLIPHRCTSFPLEEVEGAPPIDYRRDFVAAIEAEAAATGTLWLASERHDSTAAYVFVGIGLVGLAALVTADRWIRSG